MKRERLRGRIWRVGEKKNGLETTDMARQLTLCAQYHFVRFKTSRNTYFLDKSISLSRRAIKLLPPRHRHRIFYLNKLAVWISRRHKELGKLEDLEESITLHRKILSLRPPRHPRQASSLQNIAILTRSRYRLLGEMEDLEDSIALDRNALSLRPPGHPDRSLSLNSLSAAVWTRHQALGKMEDLEESISLDREAVSLHLPSQPDHALLLHNLAVNLRSRYRGSGKIDDVEESIALDRDALILRPPGHPHRTFTLHGLAAGLWTRYRVSGKMEDLEESISLTRNILSLRPPGHPYRASSLHVLAGNLRSCYEALGTIEDLEESIFLERNALSLRPPGHPERALSLQGLAVGLWTRYRVSGKMEDQEESISLHRDALSLRPPGHPDHASTLHGLATVLWSRHQALRKIEDLEESIALGRSALSLLPTGHPQRPFSLHALAACLWSRYQVFGQVQDVEESISLDRNALALIPPGHPNHAVFLHNLAVNLRNLAVNLRNLAVNLRSRYRESRKMDDIEESISLDRNALSLHPPGHPDRATTLHGLATGLRTRYQVLGNISDLEEAISLARNAITLLPPGQPDHCSSIAFLAKALLEHQYVILGQEQRMQEAFDLYELAVSDHTSFINDRLQAAFEWAFSGRNLRHKSTLSAYTTLLRLLNQILFLHSSIESQQRYLATSTLPISTVAPDAASAAIEAGKIELAVEFLEQGRAMLWSRIDGYKYPFQQLREVEGGEKLADRLESLGDELEHFALPSNYNASTWNTETSNAGSFADAQIKQHRILSEEWEDLVGRIHQIDGFKHFLTAPPFDTLQSAAAEGPVILVNISEFRSDAIILLKGSLPVLVELPEIQLAELCAQKLATAREISSTQRYLWDNIVSLIVDCLTKLGIPLKSRIWWCPTAELTGLPLHAAGRGKQNLQDIYTSSYTSTLSSLIKARSNGSQSCKNPKLLIIGEPSAKLKLAKVTDEVEIIKSLTPDDSVNVLFGPEAQSQAVLDALKDHPWIHFACHGHLGDDDKPFRASFELHDRRLLLLDLIRARLPNAELAFLSACHTAEIDPYTPDESIHLAAALQFCGFRSVVGTLWEMDDADGPMIAEEFYNYMFRNPDAIDFRDSAYALNHAINAMRKAKVSPERWVLFVHIGA